MRWSAWCIEEMERTGDKGLGRRDNRTTVGIRCIEFFRRFLVAGVAQPVRMPRFPSAGTVMPMPRVGASALCHVGFLLSLRADVVAMVPPSQILEGKSFGIERAPDGDEIALEEVGRIGI